MTTVLLRYEGNLLTHGLDRHKLECLLAAYAELDHEDLSRCVVRLAVQKGAADALLATVELVGQAMRQARVLKQVNEAAADDHMQLANRLQLGAAALLQPNYKDTLTCNFDGMYRILYSKEMNIKSWFQQEKGTDALALMQEIEAKTLFSQPVMRDHIIREFQGPLVTQLVESGQSGQLSSPQLVVLLLLVLLNVPHLVLVAVWPPFGEGLAQISLEGRFWEWLCGVPADFQSRILKCPGSKERFSLSPYVISTAGFKFLYAALADLAVAVAFTVTPNSEYIDITLHSGVLLFALASLLAYEIQEVSSEGLSDYWKHEFNRIDAPTMTLTAVSIVCVASEYADDEEAAVLMSISTTCLWLRMLRPCCVIPGVGPLVLMVFDMVAMVMSWIILMMIFVLAFAAGATKLAQSVETTEACGASFESYSLGIRYLFEGSLSGEGYFDCFDHTYGTGYLWVFFIVANVLMLNMLIAMMAESFNAGWESQVANGNYLLSSQCLLIQRKPNTTIPALHLLGMPYELMEWLWWRSDLKVFDAMQSCANQKGRAVLAKAGSATQLVFDHADCLRNGKCAPLTFTSKASGDTRHSIASAKDTAEEIFHFTLIPVLIGSEEDAVRVVWDDGFVARKENNDSFDELVFDVCGWSQQPGATLFMLKEGDDPKAKETRRTGGGRSFVFNKDGTISPTQAPHLVLGLPRILCCDRELMRADSSEVEALMPQICDYMINHEDGVEQAERWRAKLRAKMQQLEHRVTEEIKELREHSGRSNASIEDHFLSQKLDLLQIKESLCASGCPSSSQGSK